MATVPKSASSLTKKKNPKISGASAATFLDCSWRSTSSSCSRASFLAVRGTKAVTRQERIRKQEDVRYIIMYVYIYIHICIHACAYIHIYICINKHPKRIPREITDFNIMKGTVLDSKSFPYSADCCRAERASASPRAGRGR